MRQSVARRNAQALAAEGECTCRGGLTGDRGLLSNPLAPALDCTSQLRRFRPALSAHPTALSVFAAVEMSARPGVQRTYGSRPAPNQDVIDARVWPGRPFPL